MKKEILYTIFGLSFTMVACFNSQSTTVQPTGETVSISPSDEYTYYNTVKPIVENYCASCHAGKQAAYGLDLTTYESFRKATEKGSLLNRINNKAKPMPQGGLMPKDLRWAIKKWADTGFKKGEEVLVNEDVQTKDEFLPKTVEAINLDQEGFEFFDLMQGHWIGSMNIMGQKMNWFAFDYRPISASHIHGIYESGTMGNLFTSFFIADFHGKKTIMARNGGILNGIYRTSYFVLDKVEITANRKYFRFVDAYGGKEIMWMELEFTASKLDFKSYTSRFGSMGQPRLHMSFQAKKRNTELSNKAAQSFAYPKNEAEVYFSKGFPRPDWGSKYPQVTSSSYTYTDEGQSLETLAELAGDPYTINDIPHLSRLKVEIKQHAKIKDHKLMVYLSKEPLTNENGKIITENGYMKADLLDAILAFPELVAGSDEFTFTYLHPGDYYLTIVADLNGDYYPSKGDIMSASKLINVKPKSTQTIKIEDIVNEN